MCKIAFFFVRGFSSAAHGGVAGRFGLLPLSLYRGVQSFDLAAYFDKDHCLGFRIILLESRMLIETGRKQGNRVMIRSMALSVALYAIITIPGSHDGQTLSLQVVISEVRGGSRVLGSCSTVSIYRKQVNQTADRTYSPFQTLSD